MYQGFLFLPLNINAVLPKHLCIIITYPGERTSQIIKNVQQIKYSKMITECMEEYLLT